MGRDRSSGTGGYAPRRRYAEGAEGPGCGRDARSAREAAAYSRRGAISRYTRAGSSRSRRRGVKRAVIVAAILALAAIVAAVWATTFFLSLGNRMNSDVSQETQAVLTEQQQMAGELTNTSPFYMLLLGVDSSDARRMGDEAAYYGNDDSAFRSDTIILARIDPGEKKVALVSIHRDTWYEIDGKYRKINAAYALGGVSKTIQVISAYAGVPIVHYAEIDMTGLSALIDALGGVEVDVPYPIDAPFTGHLDAGLQTLDGEQALIFARSRHAYDDLGDGDRYRAAHQRALIAAVLDKLMASNPATMVSAIGTIADYIDTDLTPDYIVSLALSMRGIDVDHDVYSTMNPTENETIDEQSVEITQEEAWARMMAEVDAGERPDADSGYIAQADDINNPEFTAEETAPAETRVVIKDASGTPGRAAEVMATLQAAGWNVEDGGVANITLEDTTVVYEVGVQQANAASIASTLGAICEDAGDTWDVSGDVMVVVGAN